MTNPNQNVLLLLLDKVLVCLYSLYTTHNAHWLGTAESHPELSFPESPKHCICTADMDLRYIVFRFLADTRQRTMQQ